MSTKQLDKNLSKNAIAKKAHGNHRFATGVAFGTIVGSAIVMYTANKIDKMVASGKVADAEDVLKRTGNRVHRIGDTARYTLRSMSGKLLRGAESIKKDIGRGADDIRETLR